VRRPRAVHQDGTRAARAFPHRRGRLVRPRRRVPATSHASGRRRLSSIVRNLPAARGSLITPRVHTPSGNPSPQ